VVHGAEAALAEDVVHLQLLFVKVSLHLCDRVVNGVLQRADAGLGGLVGELG
jgi:hypothetical protein